MSFDGKAFGAEVVDAVKGYVAKALTGLVERVSALEAREAKDRDNGPVLALAAETESLRLQLVELAAKIKEPPSDEEIRSYARQGAKEGADIAIAVLKTIPFPKGDKGDAGPGPTEEQIVAAAKSAVEEWLKANPPKDGDPGKSVEGAPGRGINEMLFDSDGNLVATMTDGTVKTVPMPKVRDGKDADMSVVESALADMRKSLNERQAPAVDLDVPEDVCEQISKAAALIAEAPVIPSAKSAQPLVVNVGNGSPEPRKPVSKTITMRRDATGGMVAHVVEHDGL